MPLTETQHAMNTFFQKFNAILAKLAPDTSRDSALQIIQEAQQYFNTNMSVLVEYDKNQVQRQIDEMRRIHVEEKREKKKFSFKNRKKLGGSKTSSIAKEASSKGSTNVIEHSQITTESDEFALRAKSAANQYRDLREGHFEFDDKLGDDFLIENCVNATIEIRSIGGICYLQDLENCTLKLAPVKSSIMLHRCNGCTFHVASQQIRIHQCTDCNFYVYATSDPIIEHCTALRFGRYAFNYDNVQEDLREVGFSSKQNKYRNVKDFGWLQKEQSPNWSVIEGQEEVEK
uniref:C-CAP/cofactor C-like domain-containing protein n=1 Tax=Percolomonas cosmopolitus TaxID=63605 RepID=A0A7S1KT14_9EUKA